MVGAGDDVEVVLDHDDRVAAVDEAAQHGDQAVDVLAVEAGRGLVEHVERRRPRGRAAELVTSFMRCASPPESVVLGWPSVR